MMGAANHFTLNSLKCCTSLYRRAKSETFNQHLRPWNFVFILWILWNTDEAIKESLWEHLWSLRQRSFTTFVSEFYEGIFIYLFSLEHWPWLKHYKTYKLNDKWFNKKYNIIYINLVNGINHFDVTSVKPDHCNFTTAFNLSLSM